MKKRCNQLQSQDYRIKLIDGRWIVGRNTPLDVFLPQSQIDYITQSDYFWGLKLLSYVEWDDNKYRVFYLFKRLEITKNLIMRITVDTHGDFEYEFENF